MRPYSQDLRDRIVHDIERGICSQTAAAAKYAVSLSFVQKLMRRVRETGSSAAKPATGGAPRKLGAAAVTAVIRAEIAKQPDITLAVLCERVATQTSIQSDESLMSRELKRLGITLKKRSSTRVNDTRHGSSDCESNLWRRWLT
jgi:transposase